jgi:hypothetical protein
VTASDTGSESDPEPESAPESDSAPRPAEESFTFAYPSEASPGAR